jgi:cell wall-associated NlpC family hydrolase
MSDTTSNLFPSKMYNINQLHQRLIMDKVLYDTILSYLHIPYIWGGENPNLGLDCSGFVIDVLKTVGELPNKYDNTAQGIYEAFVKNSKPKQVGLGALCFYGSSSKSITHIGIMIDDFRVVEAGGGGSSVKTLKISIEQNARIRIRPYGYRNDLQAVLMPEYKGLNHKL